MERKFIDFISSFTSLSEQEEQLLLESYPIKKFKKGDSILTERSLTNDTFLILEGCIRKHREIEGVDKTSDFFMEGDAVAEFSSLSMNKPTLNSYSCLEDTIVVVINSEKEKKFYEKFPRFEEITRLELEKILGANQERLSNLVTLSVEERYKELLIKKPNLFQRAPQHQIASYLGITPESLSRIRKRIAKQ